MYIEKSRNSGVEISNKLFANQEIKVLSKNKYVKNVSMKGITYKLLKIE